MTEKSIEIYISKSFFANFFKGEPFNIYLDNLSVHRNQDVIELCEENRQLLFTTPYSSHLSRIERLWLFAKMPFRKRCLLEAEYDN